MMLFDRNIEMVMALAPDADSAKEGQKLAAPGKWLSLGHDQSIAWGLFQGSGKTPYQIKLDTLKLQKNDKAAVHCTCPSHKQPCKHGLGLAFILVQSPVAVPESAPPEFVTIWRDKAAAQARRQQAKKEKAEARAAAGESIAPARAPRAKAADERRTKIDAGVEDLDLWLHHLIQSGLADPQIKKYSFWDGKAARMVDAQVPGLARWLHELGGLPAAGGEWMPDLLTELGSLYLALQTFKRFDSLSAGMQADLRTLFGWHLKREEIDTADPLRDTWQIVGQRFGDEGQRLRSQRLWLVGQQSGQAALILEFTYGDAPFETRLSPGVSIDADLVFFPGTNRLRAFINKIHTEPRPLIAMHSGTLPAALDHYAKAITNNPWLNYYPFTLSNVYPTRYGGRWVLRDADGAYMSIHSDFTHRWSLLALSGAYPLDVAGEWDGREFWPTGVCIDSRFVDLNRVGKL